MSNNKRPFLHYIGMTESGVPAKNRSVNYDAQRGGMIVNGESPPPGACRMGYGRPSREEIIARYIWDKLPYCDENMKMRKEPNGDENNAEKDSGHDSQNREDGCR